MVFERREGEVIDFNTVRFPLVARCRIMLGNEKMEEVSEFKYLGTVLCKHGSILDLVSLPAAGEWLNQFGLARNLFLMVLFMALTMYVVSSGVADGIERWSTRLMPMLFALFAVLIIYIFTQDGANEGLKMYLIHNFDHFSPSLLVSAMGQAFFSLSLSVGTMLVYGSYLGNDTHIPKTAAQVVMVDTGVAVGAGLLILPAMYVAHHNGVQIFSDTGALLSSDTLVFTVLPSLFDTMGTMGVLVSIVFFLLMIIAALTSSISMLEVPVSCAIEQLNMKRGKAVLLFGTVITLFSAVIVFNFSSLFGFVVNASTVYGQPLLGLVYALVFGWIWKRDKVLQEIRQGYPEVEKGLFWKIWPWYVKLVCPVLMILVFLA